MAAATPPMLTTPSASTSRELVPNAVVIRPAAAATISPQPASNSHFSCWRSSGSAYLKRQISDPAATSSDAMSASRSVPSTPGNAPPPVSSAAPRCDHVAAAQPIVSTTPATPTPQTYTRCTREFGRPAGNRSSTSTNSTNGGAIVHCATQDASCQPCSWNGAARPRSAYCWADCWTSTATPRAASSHPTGWSGRRQTRRAPSSAKARKAQISIARSTSNDGERGGCQTTANTASTAPVTANVIAHQVARAGGRCGPPVSDGSIVVTPRLRSLHRRAAEVSPAGAT